MTKKKAPKPKADPVAEAEAILRALEDSKTQDCMREIQVILKKYNRQIIADPRITRA